MKKVNLIAGDVVQIDPNFPGFFRSCFMVVTNPHEWGAQGYIAIPTDKEHLPNRAYFRATWEQMEYIGRAMWVPVDDVPPEPDPVSEPPKKAA